MNTCLICSVAALNTLQLQPQTMDRSTPLLHFPALLFPLFPHPLQAPNHLYTSADRHAEQPKHSQVVAGSHIAALARTLGITTAVAHHVHVSRNTPQGAAHSSWDGVSQAGDQKGGEDRWLVLDVVCMRALGAVEQVGFLIDLSLLLTRVGVGVGDAGRLAVFASVEAVDNVEDEGGGRCEQDVAIVVRQSESERHLCD